MRRICVVGAGAVGGTVAARLALAGREVSVIARGAQLQAIRAHGLTLVDELDRAAPRTHVVRLPASDRAADLGAQDAVILALKGPSIGPVLASLAPLLGAGTVVVPAINGIPWWYFHRDTSIHAGRVLRSLDAQARMFADLDPDRLIGCVVMLACETREPGVVAHTAGIDLILGEPARGRSARIKALADGLCCPGLNGRVADDIRGELWAKLLGSLSLNPIAALTGLRVDAMLADADLLELVRTMMREARAVADALGVAIPISNEQRIDLARSIGAARLSTLQDFEAARRPELEGLLSAVIEMAALAGVAVPTIRHVSALAWARARQLGLVERAENRL